MTGCNFGLVFTEYRFALTCRSVCTCSRRDALKSFYDVSDVSYGARRDCVVYEETPRYAGGLSHSHLYPRRIDARSGDFAPGINLALTM